jgi:death on curing protein
MIFQIMPVALVELIHDAVLNLGELPGRARDKSLEGALARVENRLAYNLIADSFDLAAAYAVAIAQGRCFNDGNRRTGFRVMHVCLDLHGITLQVDTVTIGQIIIRTAQRQMDEAELGHWLRQRV